MATAFELGGRRWTVDLSLGQCRVIRDAGGVDLLAVWETAEARRAFVDRFQSSREMVAFGRMFAASLREPTDKAFWQALAGRDALARAADAFWKTWIEAFAGSYAEAAAPEAEAPPPDPEWEDLLRQSQECFAEDYIEVVDADDVARLYEPRDPWERLHQWAGETGVEPWTHTWHEYRHRWIGRRRLAEEPIARLASLVANAALRKHDGRPYEPADFTLFLRRRPHFVARPGHDDAEALLRQLGQGAPK